MSGNAAGRWWLCLWLACGPLGAVAAGDHGGKSRPVMKVVRMLEDMKTQLEKEMADDKEVYEMLACWCKTNDEEKSKAIADGEAQEADLKSSHGEYEGKIDETKAMIADTRAKLEADQRALDEATEMRAKEAKLFHGEETDLLQAIQSCKQAVVVLSKHHPSMAQMRAVAKSLSDLQRLPQLVSGAGHEKLTVLKGFLEENVDQGAAALRGPGSYAPQSGQILGILKQMKEDFETALAESQKQEKKAVEDFEEMKAAKEAELEAGQTQLNQLRKDQADFGEKLAATFEQMEDTREQLRLDNKFLIKLKQKCEKTDKEYETRMAGRMQEISAVEDTIAFLNSPEAFNLFDKTVNTALLQVASVPTEQRRRAIAALRRVGSPALLTLATQVQIDAFTKVKAAIDKMVAELQKQQQDEVDHRDWCKDNVQDNTAATNKNEDKKTNLEAEIEHLKKEIATLAEEIEAKKAAVVETNKQMTRASDTREAENADFKETVNDARLTQVILKKAIERMEQAYFLQQPGAPHVQTSATKDDPGNGPARFTEYSKNAGGRKVITLIEEIVKDAAKAETEAMFDEESAQTSYELFMKDSNENIVAYNKAIVDLSENKAKAEDDLQDAEANHKDTMAELESLAAEMGDLHKSCDYILKNFEARQKARAGEIDGLREAKAYLSGMK